MGRSSNSPPPKSAHKQPNGFQVRWEWLERATYKIVISAADQRALPWNMFRFLAGMLFHSNLNSSYIRNQASGVSVGTSQISASAQGVHSKVITLTLNRLPSILTSIQASPSNASIQAGSVQQFSAVGYDQFDMVMTGVIFTWSSSVTSVASVKGVNSEGQNAGVATGLAAGSTQITVSAGGVNTTVSLTVTAPPPPPPAVTTINVMPGDVSINTGGTQQFSALATDQNGLAMSGVAFTWTSSDPTVATIDANGLATAVGDGTTQISASAHGVSSNAASLTDSALDSGCPAHHHPAFPAHGVGRERKSRFSHYHWHRLSAGRAGELGVQHPGPVFGEFDGHYSHGSSGGTDNPYACRSANKSHGDESRAPCRYFRRAAFYHCASRNGLDQL